MRQYVKVVAVCCILIGLTGFESRFSFLFGAESRPKYPTIKLTGLLQGWLRYDNTRGSNYGDDIRVARARLGLKGYITPKIDYLFLSEFGSLTYVDPITLLDAWFNYKYNDLWNIKIGQTWYKFSLNGTTTIPTIPLIYRPEVIEGIWLTMGKNGSYGYDKGIEFWGEQKKGRYPWGYFVSVTTGTGLAVDRFEDNVDKDMIGRFWVEVLKGLRIGASGFRGTSTVELSNGNEKNLPEYAYGIELSYAQKYFRFIAEYLHEVLEGHSDNYATKRPQGWYAVVGFNPLPWLEIPVQYAWYEKDGARRGTGLRTITVGLTWFLKEGTLNNVKFNYIVRNAQDNYGSNPRNMVALQVQLAI